MKENKENESLKKIELIMKVVTLADGRSFKTFKGVKKDKKLIDVKFRKECEAPESSGYIYVKKENMDIDKSRKYPCVWVHAIEKFDAYDNNKNDLTEIFD